jgi:thioredoxin reductase (NADPH)
MENDYDFLIIGGGGVGLAAAMYGARLGLKTIVFGSSSGIELPIGGTITTTNLVENYPGFTKTSGIYLAKQIEDHAKSYDLVTIKEEKVTDITQKNKNFIVKTSKSTYLSKTILFATGSKLKKLDSLSKKI